MTGLGVTTDALVTEGVVRRTREGGRTVLDAPSRRDFWFGHGFVLDEPPDAARLAALIDEGRRRFRALGAVRFVVQWERADGDGVSALAPPGVMTESNVVLAYAGGPVCADARVRDHDDAAWTETADMLSAEYPQQGTFPARRVADLRRDVEDGRARAVGIREDGRLACAVALYRANGVARFSTVQTRPESRGRGLFTACARTLIAWANTDTPRTVVIVAEPDGDPLRLYRTLGFAAVSRLDAVIVPT